MALPSRNQQPRIVQVIAPAAFGGAETVVRLLSEELVRAGVDITVIALTPNGGDHPWVETVRHAGLSVRCISAGLRGYRDEVRQLRAVLQEIKPTAVHSHGYRADLASMFAARKLVPWVSTVHGFTHISARASVYQIVDRLALGRAARVIVVASHITSQLSRWGVSRSRIDVIRNAFRPTAALSREDARALLDLPANAKVVGWVGRVSSEKGPDLLVEALSKLSQPAIAAIIGDGPARPAFEEAIKSLPAHVTVRQYGARRDAATLMRAFDVLSLSSRTEGMPLVVLESMAVGTPVVSFDVGDVSHAVSRESGWIVKREDTAALAATIDAALSDDSERAARSAASIAITKSAFSADEWAHLHMETYANAGR